MGPRSAARFLARALYRLALCTFACWRRTRYYVGCPRLSGRRASGDNVGGRRSDLATLVPPAAWSDDDPTLLLMAQAPRSGRDRPFHFQRLRSRHRRRVVSQAPQAQTAPQPWTPEAQIGQVVPVMQRKPTKGGKLVGNRVPMVVRANTICRSMGCLPVAVLFGYRQVTHQGHAPRPSRPKASFLAHLGHPSVTGLHSHSHAGRIIRIRMVARNLALRRTRVVS